MNGYRLFIIFLFISSVTYAFSQSVGNASFYANKLHGHYMSNGERYHRDSMTCAHRTLPLGTMVKVTNPRNHKSVIVEVTDRGPHTKRFLIDLSYAAAKELDIIRYGYCPVEVEVCEPTVIPYKMEPATQSEFDFAPAPILPSNQWMIADSSKIIKPTKKGN